MSSIDRADVREQRADLDLVGPELRERVLRTEADELLTLELRELLPLRETLGHRLAMHLARAAGLGSNVSSCEGPPAIVSQMTRLARCGNGSEASTPCGGAA